MSDSLDRLADRLDRVVDRLDRVVDRLDNVRDRQDQNTRLLKEIKTMTAASGEASQALLDAVAQLDAALTEGLQGAVSTLNDLNATIQRLEGVDDSTRQQLLSAASAVTNQVTRVTQGFSVFKQDPSTPPEPQPVPDPEPAPEPGPVAPSDNGGGDSGNGDLSFGP